VTFRLVPQAARELARADAWWRENRPTAPHLLADEVFAAIAQVVDHPDSGLLVGSRKNEPVRRVLAPISRRLVYYFIDRGVVTVLRVVGAERGTQPRFSNKTDLS
jgi:plasmid stabilization system protein ParE